MAQGTYHGSDERVFYLNGSPLNTLVETVRRDTVTSDLAALTSGVMLSIAVPLAYGDVVTNLTFVSGATALGAATHWWFALYNSALALALQTADQVAAAWAANTAVTLALAGGPYTVPSTGVYYAAIMVAATTVPSLRGVALGSAVLSSAVVAGQVVLAQTSGSALLGVAPGTIASPVANGNLPYVVLN